MLFVNKQRFAPERTQYPNHGTSLTAAAQNVRGMAELLKHQAVLSLRQEYDFDVLFLTETHAKSYYSFHSEGHLAVVSGNTKEKWAGVTAVIAPHIIPYVQNIIQHTARILQIALSARSGDIHFIGIYAPHHRTEVEQQKLPDFRHTQPDTLSRALLSLGGFLCQKVDFKAN